MIQLPFSAAAAVVLVGAVMAGGAIGVMTVPPAKAPSAQARAEPAAAPPAARASEQASETQPSAPKVEQIVVESATPPTPAPLQPENVVRQSETTTVVSAPVIVTGPGFISGCVGCIEHRNDDKVQHPAAKVEHPTPQHAAAPRREIPSHEHFVRPPQVASVSAHTR